MTLSSYKILIVDDNPTFAKTLGMLIKTILGNKLARLDEASNGKEAIEMALQQDERYHLIFMDVNMPEMDGITATKLINKELYRDTKIVAVSFNKDFETLNGMLQSGAKDYICKDNLTLEKLEKVFTVEDFM
jgi:two-component system, NarL family, sensor histidine kinase BarA